MRKSALLTWTLLLAVPMASEAASRTSVGYAFSHYLDYQHSAPVGAFLSLGGTGQSVTLESDLGYHHDSELNTVTLGLGPHFALSDSKKTAPFIHLLGGARFDIYEGDASVSAGGMAGLGIDIPSGSKTFVRLGADFQMFFFDGFGLKTLRLNAGISF